MHVLFSSPQPNYNSFVVDTHIDGANNFLKNAEEGCQLHPLDRTLISSSASMEPYIQCKGPNSLSKSSCTTDQPHAPHFPAARRREPSVVTWPLNSSAGVPLVEKSVLHPTSFQNLLPCDMTMLVSPLLARYLPSHLHTRASLPTSSRRLISPVSRVYSSRLSDKRISCPLSLALHTSRCATAAT